MRTFSETFGSLKIRLNSPIQNSHWKLTIKTNMQ